MEVRNVVRGTSVSDYARINWIPAIVWLVACCAVATGMHLYDRSNAAASATGELTLTATTNGAVRYVTKNIENICEGDLVASYNVASRVVEYKEVTDVFSAHRRSLAYS